MDEQLAMRKALVLLILALFPLSASAQILQPIVSGRGYHYVDAISGSGSDSNPGTAALPWATVAQADAALPANAPLKFKYPDGTWHNAPAYWDTLKWLFPMVRGVDPTKVYDVASGLVCTITGSVAYPSLSGASGIQIATHLYGWVDCGDGTLGIGTGDQTVLVRGYMQACASENMLTGGTLVSNGSLGGGVAGWSLMSTPAADCKLYTQLRNADSYVSAMSDTLALVGAHSFGHTVDRSSATGIQDYLDGSAVATGDGSALDGQDLTNASAHGAIGARHDGSVAYHFATFRWLNEVRIYASALSPGVVAAAGTEMAVRDGAGWGKFPSGTYYALGQDGGWATSTTLHLWQAFPQTSPQFAEVTHLGSYTGRAASGFGNPTAICVNASRCNGTTASQVGEINWVMTHEVPPSATARYVATSYDGLHWEYKAQLGTSGGGSVDVGAGTLLCDGDCSNYQNVHDIGFENNNVILESHPTAADFSSWSTPVVIYTVPGDVNAYNPGVYKIGSTWRMIYSYKSGATRVEHRASCSTGCFTATNDWTEDKTGDWMGLGAIETPSILHLGGTSWRLFYVDIADDFKVKYADSADNMETFSVGATVPTMTDLSTGVGVMLVP